MHLVFLSHEAALLGYPLSLQVLSYTLFLPLPQALNGNSSLFMLYYYIHCKCILEFIWFWNSNCSRTHFLEPLSPTKSQICQASISITWCCFYTAKYKVLLKKAGNNLSPYLHNEVLWNLAQETTTQAQFFFDRFGHVTTFSMNSKVCLIFTFFPFIFWWKQCLTL